MNNEYTTLGLENADLVVVFGVGRFDRNELGEGKQKRPEAIQIRAVEPFSDEYGWRTTREYNQLVRPTYNPFLSDYIKRLTGITQ